METLVFDIETDGLLDTVTQVFCMSIWDGKVMHSFRPEECRSGVQMLLDGLNHGAYLVGHNIIDFDIPALHKLYPWFDIPRSKRGQVIDTLVMARLIKGNIIDSDMIYKRVGVMPGKLVGSQSLKAWGYRLGNHKGTYAEDNDDAWGCFNEDMLEYNRQDVRVTTQLYEYLKSQPCSPAALKLEHDAAWLMSKQERNGFPFDVESAEKLELKLRKRESILSAQLMQICPQIPDKVFVPKRDNKKMGYKKGVPIQRYKDFNPNSRQQIEWIITKHFGYVPTNPDLYTEKGNLKVDEDTFHFLATDKDAPDEVKSLAVIIEEYLMIKKRLGQLADGNQAWLKLVKTDGKIHGKVNPCGAVTGRATHSNPNVTQVPHNASPYGEECRSLFGVPEGWVQAGIDACGLELRCLAHFLYPYDKGTYSHVVVHGDIHTMNQTAAGLATRDEAKRFIYAFLYGAGDKKIGGLVGGDSNKGKEVKARFLAKTPAIQKLKDDIESVLINKSRSSYDYHRKQYKLVWRRHYLLGLDKRRLHVRSLHSALNLLLQSAGAVVCKHWIVRTEERLLARGLKHGWDGDFALMAWVHDEQQIACRNHEIAEIVVAEAQQAMRDTQAFYHFNVQLDTEGIIGRNWCECH